MLSSRLFMEQLKATQRREVIREMTATASLAEGLDPQEVEKAVWSREEALSTGIGNGVAIPHARIQGLKKPIVVSGISQCGIDFDAPDDKLAHVIFLILTPASDPVAQLNIASEIARLFRDPSRVDKALCTRNFKDFLVLVRPDGP
jgi:PTS system nitrogen regulatory IIA component